MTTNDRTPGPVPGEPPSGGSSPGVLSVSALTARIKACLEDSFRLVRVEGEVSNYKLYPSGHRYFSLKDAEAQVRVVLFRSREGAVAGEIRDGQTVVVTGSLGVFEKRGEYQIYARTVEVGGRGRLLAELERLKGRLLAEGLFDEGRKRELPRYPRRIGIVTSRQGAVLRDMVRIARKRWPAIGITLAPAMVQGQGAAEDIAAAIGALCARGGIDLIIVGRGGGSVEDLWAFNEEAVVRAVAAAPVPVISAVGHETDTTLCDYAADRRAPTPTAAAQMAVPDREECRERVEGLLRRARKAEQWRREGMRREAQLAARALSDPRPLVAARRYALAESVNLLADLVQGRIREGRRRVAEADAAVRLRSPKSWVLRKRCDVDVLRERIARRMEAVRAQAAGRVKVAQGALAALDPCAVLSRGYAIVTREETGAAVRSPGEVAHGDALRVRVTGGTFGARAERRTE